MKYNLTFDLGHPSQMVQLHCGGVLEGQVVIHPPIPLSIQPKKGKQEMHHAAVSTESEFFLVKVFNKKLKDKFTPSKIIMISEYYWHSCFLEMIVSKHIIRKDGNTRQVNKLQFQPQRTTCEWAITKSFVLILSLHRAEQKDHILCDLNDSTGTIECKEWNKLQLTFLELSKTGEKLYLKSR
ncbi:hypothetical protein MJG53_001512, partial [Ovis ammon polii x Ovis aries]